ncbi:MAG: polysaccharide lyase 8 family protein [Opitutae bacterium]|nr:polysaccharide lyase 8 family protein [Opitutae bacterium]
MLLRLRFRFAAEPPALAACRLLRILVPVLLLSALAAPAVADEFDLLRQRWVAQLTGGTAYNPADPDIAAEVSGNTSSANSYWSSLNKAASRTSLWSDAASTTVSADINSNYSRLRAMALAYATTGSSLKGNASLRADLLAALDWMYANRYNENVRIYDNWWHFEIGSPMALNDIVALLYDDLSADQLARQLRAVEKFTPSPTTPASGGSTGTFTGANRMWKIQVVAIRGLLAKDAAKLRAARDAFSELFLYVTSGDGFYVDGSFVQHNKHPYTGGYGASLLSTISQVLTLINGPLPGSPDGSTWRVTDPNLAHVFRWIYDAYEPLVYRGGMMVMTQGREASRSGSTEHGTGHGIMHSILRLVQFAPSADRARMRAMVKAWALADTSRNFAHEAPMSLIPEAQQLLANPSELPREELLGCTVFASMDRVVHLGLGFGLGLSMSSTRIYTYESINGENLKGWYTSDGMTYLYNADLTQFTDSFWPTVNPRRLPGTTVDATQTRANASGQSTTPTYNWVGGASLGRYGAAGMQLDGWSNTLTAKKSWFFCDDEIVCLGAGIASTDHRTIETTVENRLLNATGSNAFTVDGAPQLAALGTSASFADIHWAHLTGRVANADIGYYFPDAPSIRGLRESRTGAWSDINAGGSATALTRHYLTLWFDHGADPAGATYAYALLPGRSAAQMAAYAVRPQFAILANTPAVQAVRETTLGLTAANFWDDARASAGDITVDRKACVLLQQSGDTLDLAVSDPTQANTGAIVVELALSAHAIASVDTGIAVAQLTPTIRLAVSVGNARGRTFRARFTTGASRPAATLSNLSTRAHLPSRDDVAIAGFVIAGNGSKRLLLRAVGPTLSGFGVEGALVNPHLALVNAANVILAENDNWSDAPNAPALATTAAAVGAFALPAASRDAALLVELAPGAYSAVVRTADTTGSGIVLIEAYDADPAAEARLINLSSRVYSGPGAQTAIVGFTLVGEAPRQLLLRAAGPALAPWGVAGVVPDPQLRLVDVDAAPLAQNDNWPASPFAADIAALGTRLGAFAFASDSRDAALLHLLGAGSYSALVTGTGNTLVEIYAAP